MIRSSPFIRSVVCLVVAITLCVGPALAGNAALSALRTFQSSDWRLGFRREGQAVPSRAFARCFEVG